MTNSRRDMRAALGAVWSMLACAGLVASCASPPPSSAPNEPEKASPVAAPASPAAPGPGSTASAPSLSTTSVVVSAASAQVAQRQATSAVELLEAGNEEQALAELQRAMASDPSNKLAQSLLKQIQADPIATLGREHFLYRVQPGESISRIAQRFLGDVHLFYVLARYNDLKVPKQLHAGQVIKVPGKGPAPTQAPTPAPVAAPPPVPPPAAPTAISTAPAAPAVDAKVRQAKIATATKAARAAYARHDLVLAIRNWDTVLELDPENNNAKIERQRAVELKAKLDRLK